MGAWADDGATSAPAIEALTATLSDELSTSARARLIDVVLTSVEDAVVLARAVQTEAGFEPQVVYANPAFTTLTGYTVAEAIGAPPTLWAPTPHNVDARAVFADGLRRAQTVRSDVVILTKSGDRRWAEVSMAPLLEENGTWYGIATLHDVTDRAELALQLAERGQELAEAQAVAHVGSWSWDVQGDVVAWSEELFRIYGLDPASFGASFEAYLGHVHPDDRALAGGNVRRSLETHEPFEAEYRIVRADGEVRWLHSRGQVLLDDDGAVRRLVGTCQDVTDRKLLEDDLRHRALHDALTGLPNRSLLEDRLEHAASRAHRHGQLTVVLFIDLDHFKQVNDRLGHDAGDRVLVSIARCLRAALRPGDTVARLGGDEFVAVCEEVRDERHARRLAQRVLEGVAAAGQEHDLGLSASVGVALSRSSPAETLIRDADVAMYRAKRAGAGRVELYR